MVSQGLNSSWSLPSPAPMSVCRFATLLKMRDIPPHHTAPGLSSLPDALLHFLSHGRMQSNFILFSWSLGTVGNQFWPWWIYEAILLHKYSTFPKRNLGESSIFQCVAHHPLQLARELLESRGCVWIMFSSWVEFSQSQTLGWWFMCTWFISQVLPGETDSEWVGKKDGEEVIAKQGWDFRPSSIVAWSHRELWRVNDILLSVLSPVKGKLGLYTPAPVGHW